MGRPTESPTSTQDPERTRDGSGNQANRFSRGSSHDPPSRYMSGLLAAQLDLSGGST